MYAEGKRKRTKHQNQPGTNQSKNNLNTSIKKMRSIRPKRKARFEKRPRPTFNFDSDSEDGGFEEEDNMGDFIVQDGTPSDATAQKELQHMLHSGKRKRKKARIENASRNPPSDKQMSYLKKLCAQHRKKMPPTETLSKSECSRCIDTLREKRFSEWDYGDDEDPPFVAPSKNQLDWMHRMCEDFGLEYPENVLGVKYSLYQWSQDIEILKSLKSRRITLTATTWPYGAGSSMKLLKQFNEGERPDITEADVLEYMKHYGSGPVKLLPNLFVACHEAYCISGEPWDEMNITAQGAFGDPTDVVRRIIRKYNDFRKNSNVVKIPQRILRIPNRKMKRSKLYEFWSKKEKNKMLPFDDETVAQLKKQSSFKWRSSHFVNACVTANMRRIKYSDDDIMTRLKSLERGGPLNIALSIGNATTGKMNFTQADVRLGLAKARRYLILSNGRPDGVQNLHWEM